MRTPVLEVTVSGTVLVEYRYPPAGVPIGVTLLNRAARFPRDDLLFAVPDGRTVLTPESRPDHRIQFRDSPHLAGQKTDPQFRTAINRTWFDPSRTGLFLRQLRAVFAERQHGKCFISVFFLSTVRERNRGPWVTARKQHPSVPRIRSRKRSAGPSGCRNHKLHQPAVHTNCVGTVANGGRFGFHESHATV